MKISNSDIVIKIKEIDIILKHLDGLHKIRKEYLQRLSQVDEELRKKNNALESLSKLTFYGIYKKLIGNFKETLEILKNHYLELSLEYKDLEKSLSIIDFEISIIENKVENLQKLKEKYIKHLKIHPQKDLSDQQKNLILLNNKIISNLTLIKEIEEALAAGKTINYKFNAAIKFLATLKQKMLKERKSKIEIENFQVKKLVKFQDYIISINHYFIKYTQEVNDVYQVIIGENNIKISDLNSFMEQYRINLIRDLKGLNTLEHSYQFLCLYKGIIMNLNKNLRIDLKQLKKLHINLLQQEQELLNSIH